MITLEERLLRAATFIRDNVHTAPSLDRVARVANLSGFHLLRVFKQAYGVTPKVYLTQCQMLKAKVLLGETSLPIAGVAAQVGFNDSSTFAARFKQLEGMTPTQYAQTARARRMAEQQAASTTQQATQATAP